jgi:hypothetical protein
MDAAGYYEWVRLHAQATGASPEAKLALGSDIVRDVILGAGATGAELGEVTARLIRRGETPRWANEHGDAVVLELRALRAERAVAPVMEHPPGDPTVFEGCPTCGDGRGWVTVPHPLCVFQGRLCLHPDNGKVVTVAVICGTCEPGRRAAAAEQTRGVAEQRPTLARYGRRVYGADGIRLLADYDRQRAAQARGGAPAGAGFRQMFPTLARRLDGLDGRGDS